MADAGQFGRILPKVYDLCAEELLPRTRVHALTPGSGEWFVKREDEAGAVLPGGKKRKYASLLPYLKSRGFHRIGIIGGANSNNLLGLGSLLTEAGFTPVPVTKAVHQPNAGNHLLFRVLFPKERIVELDSDTWQKIALNDPEAVEAITQLQELDYLVPEGAACTPALPGALTLMADILRNEAATGLHFDHIYVDAGTGFSAAALIVANAMVENPAKIHVVLVAGTQESFDKMVRHLAKLTHQWFDIPLPDFEDSYSLYKPETAAAFGSVNASVLQSIPSLARKFGIYTDPIYTAKLFRTALGLGNDLPANSRKLIIHSGGLTSLPGFSEKIEQFL